MAEAALLLVWPALIGYAEGAAAYVGETLRPGRLGRYAIWGVRLGWLAQTALLAVQAASTRGFPWGTWAGSLNLFVWMCVGCYLIWGCRPSYRLLGLCVVPLATALLALAWVAGGTGQASRGHFGSAFLALHVGLIVAAFAGFTVAAGLASLYLWQERRLKLRAQGLLRVRAPALATLDRLAARTVAVALALFTLGAVAGLAPLQSERPQFDAVMAITVAAWAVYAALLVLRYQAGWRGRRSAYLALLGFLLVLGARVGAAPAVHF